MPKSQDYLPYPNPDFEPEPDGDIKEYDQEELVNVLRSYFNEADQARKGGANPRDTVWRENWDRYWGRYNTAGKAEWQSTHVMPESPALVDRWSSAMREALDGSTGDFFTVVNAAGDTSQLAIHVAKAMRVILSRCSRTMDGHVVGFSSIFEEQMKLGSLMACCMSVTWDVDKDYEGWVRMATVDPREYWADPKGRNLYRIRQYEIDRHDLLAMAKEEDENGERIYDIDGIIDLIGSIDEELRVERERSSGSGDGGEQITGRKPVKLEEFLCTIVMPDGEVVAENSLVVVANDIHVIRGPEPNPFWHERDWLFFCPMISVPMSVYGRTYMEDWSDVADAFVELTNLILDGVFVSTIRAFIANPSLLDDPTALVNGISPNMVLTTDEEIDDLRRFIASIDMGQLPPEAFTVWKALKAELQEGAKLNEIALGQMAPKSRTTATEIVQAKQSGSSMIRSIARDLEDKFLEPALNAAWITALQHMDFMQIADQIGVETAMMLNERREEFAESGIRFQVRGLSGLIDRQAKLQSVMQVLQVIGQNQLLGQAFLKRTSPDKLLEKIFSLFGLDLSEFAPSQMDQLLEMITEQQGGGQEEQPGTGSPPAVQNNQDLVA